MSHSTTPGTPAHDDHLKAQHELVECWRVDDFLGEEYLAFLETATYDGYKVLSKLVGNGKIFPAAEKLCGTSLVPTAEERRILSNDSDTRDNLVWESLERGSSLFTRRGMRLAKWDPAKGASLETYFINGCVMKFKDVFVTWRKQRERETYDDGTRLTTVAAPGSTEAELIISAVAFEAAIATENSRNQEILRLRYCDDLMYQDIAEKMKLSPHIIRGVLDRFKTKVTKAHID